MKLLLATSNPHKLQEIRAVITDTWIQWLTLADLGREIAEPVEDGVTFEDNAVLKARYYAQATALSCIADDSGLEVDALQGEPGVRSARYAGITGPRDVVDPANNALLMQRLGDTPANLRSARFVCAMALAIPRVEAGKIIRIDIPAVVRGTVEGRIITRDQATDPAQPHRGRGVNGFGYDPLFLVPDLDRTTAEISPDHKNAISHRGQASRLMQSHVKQLFGGSEMK